MMGKMRYAGLAFAIMALAGCGGSGNSGGSSVPGRETGPDETTPDISAAIIQTASHGYDASAIEIVDLAATTLTSVPGYYPSLETDFSVWAQGSKFYQLGQSSLDTLLKVDIANPNVPDWQYSTKDDGAATYNPHALVFKNESSAYLINYSENTVWQIDLNATSAATLRTVALDLSAYGGGDVGGAEAAAGVIVNGRLYVLMQRQLTGWVPGDAFIAVFDVATNTELDLDIDPVLKGIPLITKNPQDMEFVDGIGLVVHSAGRYYPQEFTGGIEVVDLDDYSSHVLVDDGGAYGQITKATVVSPVQGYFVAYAGWQNTSLYRFNPTTGEVSADPLPGFVGKDIRMLATDHSNRVWVGLADAMAPHVVVLNPGDESTAADIATSMNPIDVAFTGN